MSARRSHQGGHGSERSRPSRGSCSRARDERAVWRLFFSEVDEEGGGTRALPRVPRARKRGRAAGGFPTARGRPVGPRRARATAGCVGMQTCSNTRSVDKQTKASAHPSAPHAPPHSRTTPQRERGGQHQLGVCSRSRESVRKNPSENAATQDGVSAAWSARVSLHRGSAPWVMGSPPAAD